MQSNTARMWPGLILALTFIYSVIRYAVFSDVPAMNIPIYVFNKAVSWSGVIYFGLSLVAREKDVRRHYGTWAFVAIVAHLIMSLMVLTPHYFGKFFAESGRMNFIGELSMLAGVIGTLFLGGLFVINLGGKSDHGKSLRAGWGRLVLCTAAVHVAVMGFSGWLTPSAWQGYLPPISLLSFMVAVFFLAIRGRRA